jgi:hypothetical protein
VPTIDASVSSNPFLAGAIPTAIFEAAVKEMPTSLHLRVELLETLFKYAPTLVDLQHTMMDRLKHDFKLSKDARGQIAQWYLRATPADDAQFPAKVKRAVTELNEALQDIGWTMYPDFARFLSSLLMTVGKTPENKSLTEYLTVALDRLNESAFSSKQMELNDFWTWVSKQSNAVNRMQLGVSQYGGLASYWKKRLELESSLNAESVQASFQEAVSCIPETSGEYVDVLVGLYAQFSGSNGHLCQAVLAKVESDLERLDAINNPNVDSLICFYLTHLKRSGTGKKFEENYKR